MPHTAGEHVHLTDWEPDLAQAAPPHEQRRLREALRVPARFLTTGPWDGDGELARDGGSALLLEGLIARHVSLGGRLGSALLGPGDLLPVAADARARLSPGSVRWTVLEPSRVALLGSEIDDALRLWPGLARDLLARSADQAARLAAHQAIAQLPRVEDRIAELLLHLAERWGRVAPEGIVLPLRLTHAALGTLVGAQRPTVSLALKALVAEQRVRQRADGAWVIRPPQGVEVPVPVARRLLSGRTATPNGLASAAVARSDELKALVERLGREHRRHNVAVSDLQARCVATRERSLELREGRVRGPASGPAPDRP